jgi:uncharacterized protein with von Willebrand factor type A (vWA) domain
VPEESTLLADVAAAFGHALHAAGVPVSPERSARFTECIVLAAPTTVSEVYWLGRVTLVSARMQIPTYDAVFDRVFRGVLSLADFRGSASPPAAQPPQPSPGSDRSLADPANPAGGTPSPTTSATPGERRDDSGEDEDEPALLAAASTEERLVTRNFATCTPEELALIRRLVEQLPLVPPQRLGRRSHRHPSGRDLDVRATLRRSHRTGGDPVHRVQRKRLKRPRRVVLIADVSGSMEPYARVYLHLMRGAVRALGAECFVFATRLTRLTRLLGGDNPDAAYARVAEAAQDWSGGTRIGAALSTFLAEHGRRGIARGAVVVIVSDGWETGDPEQLAEAMARLDRLAHHIVWVNPRSAAPAYLPLVRGMAAALPFVDTFVSGHSLGALQDVLRAIAAATTRHTPHGVKTLQKTARFDTVREGGRL